MKAQPESRQLVSDLDNIRLSLQKLIVGQDEAIEHILNSLSRCIAGLTSKESPLLTLLFLGSTGVGKTETVRVLADLLFGNRKAFTRINCQEFSAHYAMAKLIGSPPGYVGGEIVPLLAQYNIDKHHLHARENNLGLVTQPNSLLCKIFPPECERSLSIVLFDEIEKAHPKFWNLLLSIIDDATLTLSNNAEVNFTNSIIIFTSNVGSKNITKQLNGRAVGFNIGSNVNTLKQEIDKIALESAKRLFPSEWLNRIDNIISFNTLNHQNLFDILAILIDRLCNRFLQSELQLELRVSLAARKYIINRLESLEYGARSLNRIIEREVTNPISHYVCAGEITFKSIIFVDVNKGALIFEIQAFAKHEKITLLNIASKGIKHTEKVADDDNGICKNVVCKSKKAEQD